MNVQMTIRIAGREVETVERTISGDAFEREEEAHRLGKEVGRVVAEQALGELAEQHQRTPHCCGRPMNSRGLVPITVQGLDGPLTIRRRRYRCVQCQRNFYPVDGSLLCGCHRVTRPLAKKACQLATMEHFTELPQLLFDQHGVRLCHAELIELAHDVGGAADRLRQADAKRWNETVSCQREWPAAQIQSRRVYVSCDGIMYCTNLREPDPQHPGEQRLIWQQMRVGCVYWQDEHDHWHKQILWGRESAEEFGASLYRLARRCGYRQAQEKIFAADGGDWCWTIHQTYFADASGILDWYHANEHVWTCAKTLFSDQAEITTWAKQALQHMREEGGYGLLKWLLEQQPRLRNKKRKALASLIHYVQPRQDRMDYPRYRHHGWQIGTGMIESTAKQLVGLRLKGPGMHWSEQVAIAITALRAHSLNHNWNQSWKTPVLNC
ncbi:MAG: ISKra4 family transposase [Caldilineaceae bacterium]|nr:ISKra4 family transposase [Caldilineaceae bacterium]